MDSKCKFFAFISYSSKDTVWGKRLQKKLEHYRMPAALCQERGWKRKPMDPVFFAPTDIQPGDLTEEIQERLRASRHLIVICSPNSARSEWVGKEIEYFHGLGRTKKIYFFIINGTPNSGNPETECFNPIINKLGLPEILGANIREKNYRWPWLNKERAYVQLISKLLGVEYDSIWQRHKRLMVQNAISWAIGVMVSMAIMFGIWKANQSFDAEIRLNVASIQNEQLPPLKDAVVTMKFDDEKKPVFDTILSVDSCCTFWDIPRRYLNKPVRFTIFCRDFLDVDTVLVLEKSMTLDIRRDPSVYGDVHFWLYNGNTEEFVLNEIVYVDGIETTSGNNGRVELFIPLENQKRVYKISASIPLACDSIVMPLAEGANVWIKELS